MLLQGVAYGTTGTVLARQITVVAMQGRVRATTHISVFAGHVSHTCAGHLKHQDQIHLQSHPHAPPGSCYLREP